jgi:hypothetical protein
MEQSVRYIKTSDDPANPTSLKIFKCPAKLNHQVFRATPFFVAFVIKTPDPLGMR